MKKSETYEKPGTELAQMVVNVFLSSKGKLVLVCNEKGIKLTEI